MKLYIKVTWGGDLTLYVVRIMFLSAQRTQYCFYLEYRLVLASDNKFGSIPALQLDDRGRNSWKSGRNQHPWPTDFSHFFNGLDLDHRPGVRESIQICCHLPEQVYTPSRNNTGSIGHSETWFAQHTSSYPPLSQLLKYIPSYLKVIPRFRVARVFKDIN